MGKSEVLPVCQRYGMGVIPYSPLACGWLSGRYRNSDQAGPMSVAGSGWPTGSTCPCRRTSASSTPLTSWPNWPTRPA
ncbi:aldo/keto reductase [Micromonospora sp. CPCC 205711]|uniref:aldo/keto reductase n=1 Tax=Micromonospora sp. CPCC 205547 TaxID=3122400 RepID=UPI002FF418FE